MRIILWLFTIPAIAFVIGSFGNKEIRSQEGAGIFLDPTVDTLVIAVIVWFLAMLGYSAILAVWTRILDRLQKRQYISSSRLWSDKRFLIAVYFMSAIATGTYRGLFDREGMINTYDYVVAFIIYSFIYVGRPSFLFKIPTKDGDIYRA